MVSTPKAPDPVQTAQTQQSMNTNTALTQQAVNMVNQDTPDGSLKYSQSGNTFIPDQNGQTYYMDPQGQYHTSMPASSSTSSTSAGHYVTQRGGPGENSTQVWVPGTTTSKSSAPDGWSTVKGSYIPQYTATTTLSPQQQAIKTQTDAASLNLGTLANNQSKAIADQLSKPFSYDSQVPADFKYTGSDAEDMAYTLGAKRLDPQFAQSQDALRSQLIASGLRPGSEAYNEQMQQFGKTKNDAYDQLTLGAQQQGYGQALSTYQQQLARQQQGYQQALTTYNEPLNAISALMSGSQVQNPTFAQTPQSNVAGVDYSGLVQNNYNQQVASSNATTGGLFGLLGTGLTAGIKYSDRRLKEDIRRVGTLDNGLPVYSYRMVGSPITEIGVMADEVEAVNPGAVFEQPNGYKMVDYRMATEAA